MQMESQLECSARMDPRAPAEMPWKRAMESPPDQPHRNGDAAREVAVVRFTGSRASLDADTIFRVGDRLLALAEEAGGSDLLLDFRNVEFVSAAALGALVRLHKKLAADGRHLTIANLGSQVREVFEVTRLDTFLDLRSAGEQTEPAVPRGRSDLPGGILVADDDPVIRRLLAARLRQEGFPVWLAEHGRQAVELYRRHGLQTAAVLLDVQMPSLDGPATLTALRQLCPAVRCCFMTGDPTPWTEEALLRMGAGRVFLKPFAFTEVLATLRRLGCRPSGCLQD
jgi:anti-anti-sigma factor